MDPLRPGEPLIRIDSDGALVYASVVVSEGPLGMMEYRAVAAANDANNRPRVVAEVNKELEDKIRAQRVRTHQMMQPGYRSAP